MPGLLQRFLPREEGFFDLFTKQAVNINAGANALLKMLSHYTGVPEQVQIVKAFEHEGDEITHAIFTKLNQTFITPFDREDIHELCSRLDDVIDLIDAAAICRAGLRCHGLGGSRGRYRRWFVGCCR